MDAFANWERPSQEDLLMQEHLRIHQISPNLPPKFDLPATTALPDHKLKPHDLGIPIKRSNQSNPICRQSSHPTVGRGVLAGPSGGIGRKAGFFALAAVGIGA